jgi:N-hydroxyarylamine O-acetyltransferase
MPAAYALQHGKGLMPLQRGWSMALDVAKYLDRLGYTGALRPDLATLKALHLRHLRTVPFENLDIHSGRAIALDETSLYEKIVLERRGGFCYELNGLFAKLLQAVGFAVTLVAASDAHSDGSFGPEFDHLALIVDIPGMGPAERWLADVGWGDTFLAPLRLDDTDWQSDGERAYRIESDAEHRLVWQRRHDGREECNYRFRLEARSLADFAAMCLFHQVSPNSPFTQKRLVTMATVEGRVTLDDERLTVTTGAVKDQHDVDGEQEFVLLLKRHFGVELAPREESG